MYLYCTEPVQRFKFDVTVQWGTVPGLANPMAGVHVLKSRSTCTSPKSYETDVRNDTNNDPHPT
jgi:hypothetical protein